MAEDAPRVELDAATKEHIDRRVEGVRSTAETALERRHLPTGRVRDISGASSDQVDFGTITVKNDLL